MTTLTLSLENSPRSITFHIMRKPSVIVAAIRAYASRLGVAPSAIDYRIG